MKQKKIQNGRLRKFKMAASKKQAKNALFVFLGHF